MYKFIADVGAGEKIMSRRCWGIRYTPYIGECGTLQMGKINGRMRFARTGGKWDWLQPYRLGRLFHFGATTRVAPTGGMYGALKPNNQIMK